MKLAPIMPSIFTAMPCQDLLTVGGDWLIRVTDIRNDSIYYEHFGKKKKLPERQSLPPASFGDRHYPNL